MAQDQAITAPREDGNKKVDDKKKKIDDKKKAEEEEEELSEEDQKLKSELEMLVERLAEPKEELYAPSLEALKTFIRTSTSSMTAVPKPLKFLRPHYPAMVELYNNWPKGDLQDSLADVLSVLGMTYSDDGKRESLAFRLKTSSEDIASWGHEYIRHLALELGEEYEARSESEEQTEEEDTEVEVASTANTEELLDLALKIVPFFLKHNAEADAVDLLLELEAIERLPEFVDEDTYARVCLYMVSCVPLLATPDDNAFLNTAFTIYLNHGKLTQALALAIRIDDEELIRSVFLATEDVLVQKQLAFMLARQQYFIDLENEEVRNCLANTSLSEYFQYLIKELNLLEPKVPEDIYKSHLENNNKKRGTLDSAKQNLAASFVNAFVNAGFGSDKLLTEDQEAGSWVYKTKGKGMYSTTASLGTLFQWDFGNGLQQLDKYMYSNDEQVKAGAILGTGIVNAGVYDETDPAMALLSEYVESEKESEKVSAIVGLGIAYAGSRRQDLVDMFVPLIVDTEVDMQISALASLSLGHVFVGSCNGDIAGAILQTLFERSAVEGQLDNKWTNFMVLGLALLFVGKPEFIEEVIETIKAIEHPVAKIAEALVTMCAYSGSGNVLQIQKFLHDCTVRPEVKKEDEESTQSETDGAVTEETVAADVTTTTDADADTNAEEDEDTEEDKDKLFQGFSVLGIAAIAMGEEIGQEMVLRHFGHLMHYGDDHIKRAVPLAMGLVSVSNPEMKVFDTLSRYSHDNDLEVAMNSIFAMGMVGAGTNNARLAQLLRGLAGYYNREADGLFTTRIAQGLLHLGKGTLTLNPFHTDRQILSRVSFAGLLTVLVAMLNPRDFILDSSHFLLYYFTNAICPRMLITLDQNLEPIKVNVRVGQAVDTVGQAGKPKTITGWVTHSTPVLLSFGERAELEDNEYISLASSLEGVVILKKNPEFMDVDN